MTKTYVFTSERLGFRNWEASDLEDFTTLNSNKSVMEFFPSTLSSEDSKSFLERLQDHYTEFGYTYFAVDILSNNEFIGFIGLNNQDYPSEFNPAVDIGWRLKPSSWGKGYATEGAKRCLDYAFNDLNLERVVSVCPTNNLASEHVMRKIGMTKQGVFNHPYLKDYSNLEKCIWYEIVK